MENIISRLEKLHGKVVKVFLGENQIASGWFRRDNETGRWAVEYGGHSWLVESIKKISGNSIWLLDEKW